MGNNANKIRDRELRNIANAPKILFVGLDGAGKSTLLHRLNQETGQIKQIMPTIGFNVEYVTYNGIQMTCFDFGWNHRLFPLLHYWVKNVKALIWVVDSADEERMDSKSGDEYSSCGELHYMLNHFRTALDGIPILVLANKQNLDNALSVEEVQKRLRLVQRVVHTPEMFMSIRKNTYLDMLPMNIFDILCEYSEHIACALPGPKIVPKDLNQKGMITYFIGARIMNKVHVIICEYLPPYDTWQSRKSKCNIFGCSNDRSNQTHDIDHVLEGLEWLNQNMINEKNCVLL